MGKLAARATLDTAGHTGGQIVTGSPNVFMGGGPAARQGDSFICTNPLHKGSGVIGEGSYTVLINGMPCARMGDTTYCGCTPPPSPVVSGAAPDSLYFFTLAKGVDAMGAITTANSSTKAFYAFLEKADTNSNGVHNVFKTGAGLLDIDVQGENFGFGLEFFKAESSWGSTNTSDFFNFDAAALRANAGYTVGDPNMLRASSNVQLELFSTSSNANLEVFTGENGKWGYTHSVGADVQAIKGEVTTMIETPYLDFSLTKEGSAGALGYGRERELILDTKDKYLKWAGFEKIAVKIGLGSGFAGTLYYGKVWSDLKNVFIGD